MVRNTLLVSDMQCSASHNFALQYQTHCIAHISLTQQTYITGPGSPVLTPTASVGADLQEDYRSQFKSKTSMQVEVIGLSILLRVRTFPKGQFPPYCGALVGIVTDGTNLKKVA